MLKKMLKNPSRMLKMSCKLSPLSFKSCFLFAAGYGKEAQGVPALPSRGIFLPASGASE